MLVLSRKKEQSIQIGGDIRVTILRIKGNCVRVGVEAPDVVKIVRGELAAADQAWRGELSFDLMTTDAPVASCK